MVLKITDFTKELHDDLEKLKNWPKKLKQCKKLDWNF